MSTREGHSPLISPFRGVMPSTSFLLPCYLGCRWGSGHWGCHTGPWDGNRASRMAEWDRRSLSSPKPPQEPPTVHTLAAIWEKEKLPLIWSHCYSGLFLQPNFLLRNACNFLYHLKDVQLAYGVYVGLSLYQACSLFPEILMIIHGQDSVVFNACFSDHCSTGIVSKLANCLLWNKHKC